MNIYVIAWLMGLLVFIFIARGCYRLDHHCGFTILLGIFLFIPAVLYLAGEVWIIAFE